MWQLFLISQYPTLLNALTDIIRNWGCSKPTQVNHAQILKTSGVFIDRLQTYKKISLVILAQNGCNLDNRSRFSAASCSLCSYRSLSLRSSCNSLSTCVMAVLFQITFNLLLLFLYFILRFSGKALSICFIYMSCSSPKYFFLKSKKVISFCKLSKSLWSKLSCLGIYAELRYDLSVLSFGARKGQATEIGKSCFSPSLHLFGFWSSRTHLHTNLF